MKADKKKKKKKMQSDCETTCTNSVQLHKLLKRSSKAKQKHHKIRGLLAAFTSATTQGLSQNNTWRTNVTHFLKIKFKRITTPHRIALHLKN